MVSNGPEQPNPRRVAAGSRNRRLRGPLTEKGREALRAAIAKHKPWLHNTGPVSADGKARVAQNGRARQKDALSIRQVRALMAEVRSLIGANVDAMKQL
jgi:hypothetical protein